MCRCRWVCCSHIQRAVATASFVLFSSLCAAPIHYLPHWPVSWTVDSLAKAMCIVGQSQWLLEPWSIGCVTAISEPHNKTSFFTCHITYFAISEVITVIHLPKRLSLSLSFHSHKSLGWVNFPLEFSWPAFLPDCGAVVGKRTAVIKCMGIQWPLKSAMCITKRQVHPSSQTCFPRLSTLDSAPPFCTTDCGATQANVPCHPAGTNGKNMEVSWKKTIFKVISCFTHLNTTVLINNVLQWYCFHCRVT